MDDEKMCPACDAPFEWSGVERNGLEFCCESCARGRECECQEHSELHSQRALGARAGANILGTNPNNQYPQDATRIKKQWFSSSDQLVTTRIGGCCGRHGLPRFRLGRVPSIAVSTKRVYGFTERRGRRTLERPCAAGVRKGGRDRS